MRFVSTSRAKRGLVAWALKTTSLGDNDDVLQRIADILVTHAIVPFARVLTNETRAAHRRMLNDAVYELGQRCTLAARQGSFFYTLKADPLGSTPGNAEVPTYALLLELSNQSGALTPLQLRRFVHDTMAEHGYHVEFDWLMYKNNGKKGNNRDIRRYWRDHGELDPPSVPEGWILSSWPNIRVTW